MNHKIYQYSYSCIFDIATMEKSIFYVNNDTVCIDNYMVITKSKMNAHIYINIYILKSD